jgi:diguanylate cyclase (GGDEF)-like protein
MGWSRTEGSSPAREGAIENITDTMITGPKRESPKPGADACLVQIYPTGPGMGRRYPLGSARMVIGRETGCDITIDDQSVSRRHAAIQPAGDSYSVFDLQSTNGTYINDRLVEDSQLQDGDHLRIGNVIYRFLAGGNVEAEYFEEIYRLTIIDGLTETHNKRYLLEYLERELGRSARFRRPLALLMFDIDFFKRINDELGHLAGDGTLRELAGCIRKSIRKEELFARYGGEEFAVVMVETTREQAIETGERLRRQVVEHTFQFEGKPYQVTISVGVAATAGDQALTTTELIQQADEKLYVAKHAGRNRVVG